MLNNDLVLPLKTISKEHALFGEGPSSWSVTDLRSTNGTYVDDHRLEPGMAVALSDGALLRLGPEVHAKFLLPVGLFAFVSIYRVGIARCELEAIAPRWLNPSHVAQVERLTGSDSPRVLCSPAGFYMRIDRPRLCSRIGRERDPV